MDHIKIKNNDNQLQERNVAKYTIDDIAQLINEDVREHNVPVINEQTRPSETTNESITGSGKGHTRKLKNKREEMRRTGKPVAPKKKKTAAEEKAERRAMKQLENLHGDKGSNKDKEEPKPLSDSINRLMYMLQEAETKIISTRERNKSDQDFDGGLVGPAMTWFQTQYNRLKARFNGGSNNPEFQKAVAALKRKADEAKRMGAADFHDEPGIAGPGNQHTNNLHSKHHPVNGPADADPRVARMLQRRRSYETRKQGQNELNRRGIDKPDNLMRGFNKKELDDRLEDQKIRARQREQDARNDERDRQLKRGRYKEDK